MTGLGQLPVASGCALRKQTLGGEAQPHQAAEARCAATRRNLVFLPAHARTNRNRQAELKAVSILQLDRNATGTRMVGHSANELLEGKIRHGSSPLQALSQRFSQILSTNRLLRADRLLLLASPAHVVQMSMSLPP